MKKISRQIIECFRRGGKLLICGIGGSAAMSQEMAAELVCSFENKNRPPLPAIALTTDTSILTAWSNDADFSDVFARQIEAIGGPEDILLVFSTSGKSRNCVLARSAAFAHGMRYIESPRLGDKTADIQEHQHHWMHQVCREVESAMFSNKDQILFEEGAWGI